MKKALGKNLKQISREQENNTLYKILKDKK